LFGWANRDENPPAISRRGCHVTPSVRLIHHFSSCLAVDCKCCLAIKNGQLKLFDSQHAHFAASHRLITSARRAGRSLKSERRPI
ncbi:hypothetical protein NZA98_33815, partial [Escherichia coli]|nr:hypothetical protein [Escherichia coli]